MSRFWPDTLPNPSEPGYRLRPVDQSLRTDMEFGARRVRRITAARLDSVEVGWVFNDAEMAAFRAWVGDEPWSLVGESGSLAGWSLTGATRDAADLVGPDGLVADRLFETAAASQHRAQRALGAEAAAGTTVVASATLKAQGRTLARLAIQNRAGQFCRTDVDLAAGTLGAADNLVARSIRPRGGGWWRVTITAAIGSGATEPDLRVLILDAGASNDYAGDGTSGIGVTETSARVATGYDLFVPTGADGRALGAQGGAGWVVVPLAFGGGFRAVEARFEGPWEATALPGLGWQVSARLEVRNA